jgi:hypothetical protein
MRVSVSASGSPATLTLVSSTGCPGGRGSSFRQFRWRHATHAAQSSGVTAYAWTRSEAWFVE